MKYSDCSKHHSAIAWKGNVKHIPLKLIALCGLIISCVLFATNYGYLSNKSPDKPSSNKEITLVTAYWNLGRFQKGAGALFYNTSLYFYWTKVFRYIMNPLVVFTDSREFSDLMKTLRNTSLHRTQVHLVNRNFTWAFRNINRIREIYSTSGYPKHHPNTVLPEYACAVHSKFDVTARVAISNVYQTALFAWLDIGYFRERKSIKPFKLVSPKGFDNSMIAMNQMVKRRNYSTYTIIKKNINWVGGGLFLGRRDLIIKFGAQFKRAVEFFLSKHLINGEQQVLYAMFSNEGYAHIKPDAEIQTYVSNGDWFFLGKNMVRELNTTFVP